VRHINAFAVGSALPELTFLLDLDAAIGHARAVAASGDQHDRMESEPLAFFESVRRGYLALAAAEPGRIAVIDASASIDEVFAALVRTFEARFAIATA
jgi:dTMP kinase